jgi:hypothetical protein
VTTAIQYFEVVGYLITIPLIINIVLNCFEELKEGIPVD